VYQEWLNDWYETYSTACDPKEGCMDKQARCNDRKICGKLHINETVETPVISTCLSVDCLELKTDRMSNKLSCEIYTPYAGEDGIHATKVRGAKVTMEKLISPVCHKVESIFCRLIILSKYEADVAHSVVSLISSSLGYIESTYMYEWN
jgi:hypothetical protein